MGKTLRSGSSEETDLEGLPYVPEARAAGASEVRGKEMEVRAEMQEEAESSRTVDFIWLSGFGLALRRMQRY